MTNRQLQVLRLFAMGRTSIEIAAELGISVSTVEAHLSGARESLGAKSSANAVYLACKRGMMVVMITVSVLSGFGDNDAVKVRVPKVRVSRVKWS
jgi:DNA-binding CsgD family transcriptional regulator